MSRLAHVFLSYVREDSVTVDRLKQALEGAGVEVWQDRANLEPGEEWAKAIVRAIVDGRFFLACFSPHASARPRSGMQDELRVATGLVESRPEFRKWLVPVRLAPCEIPALPIGNGQTLDAIQRLDLFPDWDAAVHVLLRSLWEGDPAPGAETHHLSTVVSTIGLKSVDGGHVSLTNITDDTGDDLRATARIDVDAIRNARVDITGVNRTRSKRERSS